MEKRKSPKGFIVVLPDEIIEIPQDSDKSWLTLFYSLPRELAEKWKPAYDLPRCPYEVLRTDKYNHIVCDDMFKLLVWDCYAWSAWQFFQVKDRKGNYRDIPGAWTQYAGYFPLWRLSYSIIPDIRMKFEQNGLGFQNLYNIPQGVEVPWLTYQQFSNLIGKVVCSLAWSTVPTAERKCGTAPPTTLRSGRITLYALTTAATREAVRLTSSGQSFWKIWSGCT